MKKLKSPIVIICYMVLSVVYFSCGDQKATDTCKCEYTQGQLVKWEYGNHIWDAVKNEPRFKTGDTLLINYTAKIIEGQDCIYDVTEWYKGKNIFSSGDWSSSSFFTALEGSEK